MQLMRFPRHTAPTALYHNHNNDFTEKFCVRIDVSEEFPFLITKMSPYYNR